MLFIKMQVFYSQQISFDFKGEIVRNQTFSSNLQGLHNARAKNPLQQASPRERD